jgi:RsiW-degrading membrane proteinase PrsW (M82 family)
MITPRIVLYALLGGVLPALLWLIFWQSEDGNRPEPKGLILTTFFFGALAVLIVIPFQRKVLEYYPSFGIMTFLLWAALEELFKFVAARLGGLRSLKNNEPIDSLKYMITASLGFAALENALFIANPLLQQNIAGTIVTGSLRFIGSSLLHTVSSATIGLALALSFYKRPWIRGLALVVGFGFAVFFHTAFNLFIVNENSLSTFLTFATVWSGVALLLFAFEKVKTIHRPRLEK